MAERKTQADFDAAVKMVMKIKDEFYRDLGEKKEEKHLHEFMALAPEERKGTIRTLLWAAGFSIFAWRALELIVSELRAREEDIPNELAFWYIDLKSQKLEPPKHAGQQHLKRNLAIANFVEMLVGMGWPVSISKKKRKQERKNGKQYSFTASGVISKVFTVSEELVSQNWDRYRMPGTMIYRIANNELAYGQHIDDD